MPTLHQIGLKTYQEAVVIQEELRHRVGLARPVRLVGAGQAPPLAAGSCNVLIWKGKQVGLILRTPKGKIPL